MHKLLQRVRPAWLVVKGLCIIVAMVVLACGEGWGQDLEVVGEAFLDDRPVEYRGSQAPGSRGEILRMLRERSWSPWLLLQDAENNLELGHYELADHTMAELMDRHPNTSFVMIGLLHRGTSAMRQKQYGRARYYFNEAILEASRVRERESEDVAGLALYFIGLAHAIEGDQPIDKTVGILEEFLEHYPEHPRRRDALYLLGELAEIRGDCPKALDYYNRVIDAYPAELGLDARNRKAQCLAHLGRLNEAKEELEEVERRLDAIPFRTDSTAWHLYDARMENALLRGEVEIALKNYPAAEAWFLPLVSDRTQHYRRRGLFGLATTYQAAGHYDSALAIYDRLLGEDSSDAVLMKAEFNRALVLQGLGRRTEADTLLAAIAGDDRHLMNDRALIEIGIGAYERGDYAAAEGALARAVSVAKSDEVRARAYTLAGVVHLAQGDPVKAIAAFQSGDGHEATGRVIEDDVPEARLLRGITLARIGRPAEAIPVLNRFLDRYAGHAGRDQAMYWLGEAYYQSSLYKAAVDILSDLVEQHPGSIHAADALYAIGWAEFKQREFVRAEASFGQLVKAFPLSAYAPESQLRRGDALFLARKYSDAIEAYRQIEKMNPSREDATYADYQEALAYYRLGELDNADTLFQSFATCHASSDLVNDVTYLRGMIALRQERYRNAIETMNRFIGASNQQHLLPRAYGAIAEAYAGVGNLRLAEGAYSIAAERFPASSYADTARRAMADVGPGRSAREEGAGGVECDGSSIVRLAIARAEIYLDAHQPAEAMREYRSLDELRLDDICSQSRALGLARNLLMVGDTVAAVDTLKGVLSRYPEGAVIPAALLDLGAIYQSLNDVGSASLYLNRVLAEHGDSIEAASAGIRLAEINRSAGGIDTAKGLLYQVAERFPKSREGARAWVMLAEMERSPERSDSVRRELLQVTKRNDTLGIQALFTAAALYGNEGNHHDAARMLEELVSRFGGDENLKSRARIALGEAYERLGFIEKARESYEAILRRYCDERYKKQAQEHLQALGKL